MADGFPDEDAPLGHGAAPSESLTQTLQGLLHELPGLVSDRVELFALELARAGSALARIVAWVVAIAILGVTAWLALWAGVVIALVGLGVHWALALLSVLLVNLAAVLLAVGQVRQLATKLSLPATRRHLTMSPPPTMAAPPEANPPEHDGPPSAP